MSWNSFRGPHEISQRMDVFLFIITILMETRLNYLIEETSHSTLHGQHGFSLKLVGSELSSKEHAGAQVRFHSLTISFFIHIGRNRGVGVEVSLTISCLTLKLKDQGDGNCHAKESMVLQLRITCSTVYLTFAQHGSVLLQNMFRKVSCAYFP